LGFSACGGPTYMFRCYYEMRNPTTGEFQTENLKFLYSIRLAAFQAGGPPEAEHLKPYIHLSSIQYPVSSNQYPASSIDIRDALGLDSR
jgi:hypothetical protein